MKTFQWYGVVLIFKVFLSVVANKTEPSEIIKHTNWYFADLESR